MNRREVDILIISALPAFYKIELYNRIAAERRIYVVFLSSSSSIRKSDFFAGDPQFDYTILSRSDLEAARSIVPAIKFLRILAETRFKELIVNGWDDIEYWIAVIGAKFKRSGVAVVVESSIFDSSYTGLAAALKRIFLKLVDRVLASGSPHRSLVRHLGFVGRIDITGGVGITRSAPRDTRLVRPLGGGVSRFLYVGRISPEKNLEIVCEFFARNPDIELYLVGDGRDRAMLQKRYASFRNVTFVGYVPGQDVDNWYRQSDVLILPSRREPWGLVIEEALYNGLPVLASSCVGSCEDLVVGHDVGLTFSPSSIEELGRSVRSISRPGVYSRMLRNIGKLDPAARAAGQVRAYLGD